jgi:hypothetical protein
MKELTIVYHYFAHYRKPVLRELCQNLTADYRIEMMADSKADLPALKVIPMSEFTLGLCEFRRLKNIWLGPWLWQAGLLRGIIKAMLAAEKAMAGYTPILRVRYEDICNDLDYGIQKNL